MADHLPIEQLVHAWLDGHLSPSERTDLAARLTNDPAAADLFARATRFEALLESCLVEERAAHACSADPAAVRLPARQSRPTWRIAALAPPLRPSVRGFVALAGLAAAALVGWFVVSNQLPEGGIGGAGQVARAEHLIVSGRVLVDGVEAGRFFDGARLEVVGDIGAAIRLADGQNLELAPATSAVVDSSADEAVVRLDHGNARIRSGDDHRRLRVDTPAGVVSGRGAEFAVDLPETMAADAEGTAESSLAANMPALLIVAVLTGQVEVSEADGKEVVPPGESRAISSEKKPMFAGYVVEVDADGKRMTLEGKPGKPGTPPQRREVRLTDATELNYFGVSRDGEHPTVGYRATVLLDRNAPDTAVSVEFGNKAAAWIGTVKEVNDEGRSIGIEIYRKGDTPHLKTFRIDEQTRTSYSGVDPSATRPTVGYQAQVWLVASTDRAAEVRFFVKTKGEPTAGPLKAGPVKESPAKEKLVKEKPVKDAPANPKTMKDPASKPEPTKSEGPKKDDAKPAPIKTAPLKKSPPADMPAKTPAKPELKTKPEAKPESKDKPTPKPQSPETQSNGKPESKPAPKPVEKPAAGKTPSKPTGAPATIARRPATLRDPRPIAAEIDRVIDRRLQEANIPASPEADDAEFLRRASIDVTGNIPSVALARAFLDDSDPDKRAQLVDRLLADPAYGRRLAALWKRLIQPKPANNGKPMVDRFTPWLADQLNANRGWNDIVHELLTTEADLARDPRAYFLSVNSESFDPKPNLLAAATGRLFLGVQLGCAECHDHPFAEWKQTEFWNLAAFYSRVRKRSKSDYSWTEEGAPGGTEITIPDGGGKAAGTVVPARFLGGEEPKLASTGPLRGVLADWITADDNAYFARAAVNRLWAQYFGRGLVEPLDGFQADFVASHPEVLDRLSAEFVASDFDVPHIVRIITSTRAYRRTSRPLAENEKDSELFARMAVKVLAPEVLYDSITTAVNADITGALLFKAGAPAVPADGSKKVSAPAKGGKVARPEPVSIGSRDEFLNFFSGAAGEAGPTYYAHGIPQLLRLMNADALNVGSPAARAVAASPATVDEKIETLYLAVLARRPTDAQRRLLGKYVADHEADEQAYSDALWILLNSSEFLLNR